MSKVVNSSASNDYFTIAGVAISSTTQPDVNGGAVGGVLSASIPDGRLDGSDPVFQSVDTLEYSGIQNITQIDNQAEANQTNEPDRQMNALRTVRTATAIRNNQWVPISGDWSADPTAANDASAVSLTSDNVAKFGEKGRYVFGDGVGDGTTKQI